MSSRKIVKKTSKNQGNLVYLHNNIQKSVKNGKVVIYEELVKESPKGITIKYYSKVDGEIDRILIVGKADSYKMKTNGEEKTLDKTELLNEVKSNKKLKFASEFIKTQKGGNESLNNFLESGTGKKKQSKKSSKKSSKKGKKTLTHEETDYSLDIGLTDTDEDFVVQDGGAKTQSKTPTKKTSKKSSKKTSKKSSKTAKKIVKK